MDVRQMRSPEQPNQPAAAPVNLVEPRRPGSPGGIGQTLTVLLIVASLLFIGSLLSRAYSAVVADTAIKNKEYQALFLTNGQVYFGKLADVSGSYVKLKDIYYLQVQQQVQPKDNKTPAEQPQISLAKLGGELHGPEDSMQINRDQVLFWENLKDNGKVVEAIKKYQTDNKK